MGPRGQKCAVESSGSVVEDNMVKGIFDPIQYSSMEIFSEKVYI